MSRYPRLGKRTPVLRTGPASELVTGPEDLATSAVVPAGPAHKLSVVLLASAVLVTAAAVTGVGWGLDVAAVRSVIPGAVDMKFLTALGLGSGAVALLLRGGYREGHRTLGLVLAGVPGVLGLGVLTEYLLHVKLGIDEVPFVHHGGRAAHIAHPGRTAPSTGVCFLLLSGALLTLDHGVRRRWRPSELMVVLMALPAVVSLIGYAYSIPAFYGPSSTAEMAVNTALCFVALGAGLLLARPRGRVLELATTTDPGGVMVRRMVPLCLVVPLVLGWLHLRTIGWGLFDLQVGTWWLAAATIGVLVSMMWWCAGTLSRSDQERRTLEKRLYDLANHDPLTGLFNRHRFGEEVDQFLARSRRYGETGSLMLFDLDRFKPINDTLGHGAGDRTLCAVARVLENRLRVTDAPARLGGDEFAVLLPYTPHNDALGVARDLAAAIADIEIPTAGATAHTTASIGLTPIGAPYGTNAVEHLERADSAMYQAKRAGGNQVALNDLVPPRPSAVQVLHR